MQCGGVDFWQLCACSWLGRGGLELKLHEVPTTDSSQVRRVQVQVLELGRGGKQVHRGVAEDFLTPVWKFWHLHRMWCMFTTNIRYESLHTSAFKVWFVVQMFYIEWFQYLTPNVFEYLISHLQRSDVVWPLCVLACQLDRANTGALSMMMMMMLLMINQCWWCTNNKRQDTLFQSGRTSTHKTCCLFVWTSLNNVQNLGQISKCRLNSEIWLTWLDL